MISLYRLDQIGAEDGASSSQDLGALPSTAVALLSALAFAWIAILFYLALQAYHRKKYRKNIEI